MALARSRSSDLPQQKSVSSSTRQLQEALYTHLDDLEKSAFIDALSAYGTHRDIFELVNALRKILNTPVKRKLFPLVRKIIRPGDTKAFDLLTKADKQSGTLPRPHLYRPHIADINVLNKHRASSLPDISRGVRGAPPTTLPSRYRVSPAWRGAWSGGEEEEPSGDRQVKGVVGDKHKTRSTRPKNSSDEIAGDVFEIDIGEPSLAGEGFGFTIRGGVEHETGVYVSSVDHGSTAYKNGLTVGDLLLEVNNISFRGIPHQEAVKIIKAATRLQLVVSRVGRIPGSHTVLESFRWTDPRGRPVSPPPEGSGGAAGEDDGRGRSGTRMLQGSDERKINILVQRGQGLGLMIRGGNEYGLGIFVSGIDPYSVAENAGIKLGDQILDVNGRSFLDISHSQAVSHLKKGRHLIMTVRDIGKIPFAKTVIDEKGWIESTRVNSYTRSASTRSLSGSITDQESEWKPLLQHKSNPWLPSNTRETNNQGEITNLSPDDFKTPRERIQERANDLLNSSEHATLNYYLGEYDKQTIGVNGLTQAMFELLNTPAKLTLLPDLRSVLLDTDLDQYDKAIIAREKQVSLATARQQLAPDTLSLASFDSADIPVAGDKHRRTMFSKPATIAKVPTPMEPLDFMEKRRSVTQNGPAFALTSAQNRRLSQSTPDLSKLRPEVQASGSVDVEETGPGARQGFLKHQVRQRTRAGSRSKSPRTVPRSFGRGKSEEPSDDSGVEINGHAHPSGHAHLSGNAHLSGQRLSGYHEQQTRGGDTPRTRENINTRNRQPHQQFITHVAEVHHREGSDQLSDRPMHYTNINTGHKASNNNNNTISYNHHHHRRERQRLWARRQDDSTTTDEDIATRTNLHHSNVPSGNSHSRHRSGSRETRSGGRVRPRSRSASSSRQPDSGHMSKGQGPVFLTVPAEYPIRQQQQTERGRSLRRYGDTGQRSSSSSVSPQNQNYHMPPQQQQHHYLHQSQQQQQQYPPPPPPQLQHHQLQQQAAIRKSNDKTSWRTPRRQDSYNTDTSTTESTVGRREYTESSTRTESTLTVNGQRMRSAMSPRVISEDTLDSPPGTRPLNSGGKHNSDIHSHPRRQNSNNSVHFEERPSRSRSKSPGNPNTGRISRSRSPQVQRKSRPTAESLFHPDQLQFGSERSGNHSVADRHGQESLQNAGGYKQPSLLQPKGTPLYTSPRRPSFDKEGYRENQGFSKRGSVDEIKSYSGKDSQDKSGLRPGLRKAQGSGNIPLIQINSHMMPRAASEAGKAAARTPAVSQRLESDSPMYSVPVKLKDRTNQKRVTISDTPTHINSSDENVEEDEEDSETGSLASTITSHKHVTSISVSAPPKAGRSVSRQLTELEATKAKAKEKYGEIVLDIVYIYRSQPTLGVAIEGGANTRQPLPKVINVQPGGSAFESGGLKVGHVILEVNGQPIVGLSHNAAARVIAEAFKSRTSTRMELLITEWSDRLLDTIQVDMGLLKVS